ncbi:MAG: division/cell wall cluster transcriptional repressor MraZ [Mycoplasmataceae bacterium]|nr:division/cell wall cluster transcriptional repressor MraZ [Mycoplasmataceae bacterium]
MFLGTYMRSIDSKNRAIIPPKLRENLGHFFYITIGADKNLELRSKTQFEDFLNRIQSNNAIDPLIKKYNRYILGNTVEVELDKIGRFTITEQHLIPTAIKNDVVFVGVGSHIEMWSNENYTKSQKDFEDEDYLSSLTQEMYKKGIKL